MSHPPLHKGARGVDYRTLIGLHSLGPNRLALLTPGDPAWDVFIGPLPFLLAPSEERPYLRESVQPRRERFDTSRDPGDNSLDSGLWVRSQTSWHLGAGQPYNEPLEIDPEVARFRFSRSAGIDPWTNGQVSLLPTVASKWGSAGAKMAIGVADDAVIAAGTSEVRRVKSDGTTTLLASKALSRMDVSATRWWGLTSTHLEWGALTGATGTGQVALAGGTCVRVAADRVWVGAGASLYEVPMGTPAVGAPFHTFPEGTIVDIDSGAGGLYVMVVGALTRIYVITSREDGSLNVPREVAVLPRGETGLLLYGYLGSFMAVGTNRGVRIADCSTSADLIIGPLSIETTGGVVDAVGYASFLYVTTGSEGIAPSPDSATVFPGLYRIDLSRPLERGVGGNAARYAWASDLCATSGTGAATSVTMAGATPWFTASGTLWMQAPSLVAQGWLESGQVTFSTAERKAWSSMTVEAWGGGSVSAQVRDDRGDWIPVTQTAVEAGNLDLSLDTKAVVSSGWLEHRIVLTGSVVLGSVGVRATPSPRRTRYLRLPLECFDRQVDRHGAPVGYDGFARDRLLDLEGMEALGEVVTVNDMRTGESVQAQIEKVQFENRSAPARSMANNGGFITLTLLVV